MAQSKPLVNVLFIGLVTEYQILHSMLGLDATQKKRWMGFDFKFKKFSIKQAIFISDIFPSQVKAHKQKKF